MAAAEIGAGASDGDPVLGRLSDFPDGAAAPSGYRRADGRDVAVLVVRRGAEFAVSDGRGVSGPGSACGLTPVPLLVDPDGTVRVDGGLGPASGRQDEGGRQP